MNRLVLRLLIVFSFFGLFILFSCKNENKVLNREEILINLGGEPRTLDPTLNSLSFGSIYMVHTFEGLMKKDANDILTFGMADKYDISKDGLTYTFHIRSNAKWSDGKPVTAKDFEYALKRGVDPKTGAPYVYMLDIIKNARAISKKEKPLDSLGVRVIEDNVIEITLENPAPYFLELISVNSVYFPVRSDIIEKYGDSWSKNPDTYIVNGPYKMTERKIDESILFEVNENYWDKDSLKAKKIRSVIMDNSNTALAAIKTKAVYFSVIEAPLGEIESLTKENMILQKPAFGVYFFEVNTKEGVLTNKDIRQALSLAIDRNYIISNVAKGNQKPAGAIVPFGMNDYKGDFRLNGGNYIDTENYEKNVLLAKSLMEKAGYANGENFPVLEIRTTPGYFTLIAEAIQEIYKKNLGIDVNIVSEEYNVTFEAMTEGKYNLARTGWTAYYSDPMSMLELFSSFNSMNYSGFNNKEYDRLLEYAKKTLDNKERMDALHKAEAILFEEMPLIPIFYREDPFMINPALKGAIFDSLGRYRFNYAYIDE